MLPPKSEEVKNELLTNRQEKANEARTRDITKVNLSYEVS